MKMNYLNLTTKTFEEITPEELKGIKDTTVDGELVKGKDTLLICKEALHHGRLQIMHLKPDGSNTPVALTWRMDVAQMIVKEYPALLE